MLAERDEELELLQEGDVNPYVPLCRRASVSRARVSAAVRYPSASLFLRCCFGADEGIRTHDLTITNRLLYH